VVPLGFIELECAGDREPGCIDVMSTSVSASITGVIPARLSQRAGHAPGWSLAAALAGFFMVTLDAVIVNVALPDIRRELAGGMSGLQWVVDGYTLMFAALLLSSGSLSDRLGARRAFGAGMVVFVIASAAARAGRVSRGYSVFAFPMATAVRRAAAAASRWSSAMRRQRTVASGSSAMRVMISATRALRSARSAVRSYRRVMSEPSRSGTGSGSAASASMRALSSPSSAMSAANSGEAPVRAACSRAFVYQCAVSDATPAPPGGSCPPVVSSLTHASLIAQTLIIRALASNARTG
jgi:hypothetical protein